MKKIIVAAIAALAFVSLFSCASTEKTEVSGLVSLDDALNAAIQEIESKLPSGTTIVVATITAPHEEIGNFVGDELAGRFNNLVTLARDAALRAVESEQQFQMSGIVSDTSAIGIGHYLGARAVVSGEFKRYEAFTQLRLRIVDVETSQIIIYSERIANDDPILANITVPVGTAKLAQVSERAVVYVNRGKNFSAEGKLDEAIQEFDKAIAIDKNFAEAYYHRGRAYNVKGDNYFRSLGSYRVNAQARNRDYRRAIADYNKAIRLNPHYAEAYSNRSYLYSLWDLDKAIIDINQAISLEPDNGHLYAGRAVIYFNYQYYDQAMKDMTQAIQLTPNVAWFHQVKGHMHYDKGEYALAIPGFETALRLDPNIDDGSFLAACRKKIGDAALIQ